MSSQEPWSIVTPAGNYFAIGSITQVPDSTPPPAAGSVDEWGVVAGYVEVRDAAALTLVSKTTEEGLQKARQLVKVDLRTGVNNDQSISVMGEVVPDNKIDSLRKGGISSIRIQNFSPPEESAVGTSLDEAMAWLLRNAENEQITPQLLRKLRWIFPENREDGIHWLMSNLASDMKGSQAFIGHSSTLFGREFGSVCEDDLVMLSSPPAPPDDHPSFVLSVDIPPSADEMEVRKRFTHLLSFVTLASDIYTAGGRVAVRLTSPEIFQPTLIARRLCYVMGGFGICRQGWREDVPKFGDGTPYENWRFREPDPFGDDSSRYINSLRDFVNNYPSGPAGVVTPRIHFNLNESDYSKTSLNFADSGGYGQTW